MPAKRKSDRHRYVFSSYERPLFVLCAMTAGMMLTVDGAIAIPATSIDNQATATYEDPLPNGKVQEINTASNLVRATVQEVAGISITARGYTDVAGTNLDRVNNGDTVYFRFDIQNIGNDGTRFFVPNRATVTSGTFQKVQYLDGTTWQDIPAAGLTSGNIPVEGILATRVVVVSNGNGSDVRVSLGSTQTANGQNQERTSSLASADDVYTIDNPDGGSSEIDGTPANNTREAMGEQSIAVAAQPAAFAAVRTTGSSFEPADNSVNYNLSLNVADTAPTGARNMAPTDLTGASVPGLGNGILIADGIPLGTRFVSAGTPPSTSWETVYQYSNNPIGPTDRADTGTWTTAYDPSNINNLRRVGFFLRDGRIIKGNTITGFQLKVEVIDPTTTDRVDNIVQVFGTTPANPTDSQDRSPNLNALVFDESGDNQPNNYNDDGTMGSLDSQGKPIVYPGIIDRTAPVTDPRNPLFIGPDGGNNNAGTGTAGEYISIPIFAPGTLRVVANGPQDSPTAQALDPQGRLDNNSDFTNKSTTLPIGVKAGDKFDPAPTTIMNTIQNSGTTTSDIKVVPTLKTDELLPSGTKVTLKRDAADGGVVFTQINGRLVPDDPTKPVLILSQVGGNTSRDYLTQIDLPAGTDTLKPYVVELIAFIDTNNNGSVDAGENSNKTIDRLYTGFINVTKESRVLDANKQPVTGKNGEFNLDRKQLLPGQYVEYRINFENISIAPPANSSSQGISARNFEITEDGNAAPNNWGTSTTNDPNSARATQGRTVFGPVNNPSDPSVTKYTNTIDSLPPQTAGSFTFRRLVK